MAAELLLEEVALGFVSTMTGAEIPLKVDGASSNCLASELLRTSVVVVADAGILDTHSYLCRFRLIIELD